MCVCVCVCNRLWYKAPGSGNGAAMYKCSEGVKSCEPLENDTINHNLPLLLNVIAIMDSGLPGVLHYPDWFSTRPIGLSHLTESPIM